MLYILLLVGILILFAVFYHRFIHIRCGNMILITGGIKTGKSMLSVSLALHLLRSQKIKVFLYNTVGRFFIKLFHPKRKFEKKPKPVIYSNVPLRCDYIPLTKNLLTRKDRFIYGSVVYVCECSLVADSMSYRDIDLNEELLLFNKLFAHETKGGYLIYDTQSVSDNHYAVKRCLNSYFYIHHTIKLPFVCLLCLQEERYSEDGQVVNQVQETVESNLKWKIVSKSVWKKYDRYCYSILTDSLPVENNIKHNKRAEDLKAREIVSFKTYKTLKGEKKYGT